MPSTRRVSFFIVATRLLVAVLALILPPIAVCHAQLAPKQPPGKQPEIKQPEIKPGTRFSAIKLVENEIYQKNIEQAMDAIDGGDWQDACDYLQAILNSNEDVFVRVEVADPKNGGKKSNTVSVKFQANNLLASFPNEGLNVYEIKYGAEAKLLLDKAKQTGSRQILGEVASRFRHTKAGGEANELLASSFMDRGEYFPAAELYRQLLGPDPAKSKVGDLILFKATLALKRAGDTKKAAELWDILAPRVKANGGLALANGQVASLKQVQEVLDTGIKTTAANPHDWPMMGGNVARNAQAKGSPPMLDFPLWSRTTFMDVSEYTGQEAGSGVKDRFNNALEKQLGDPNAPLMPGGFPIAANGLLYFRSYANVTAVYLRDQKDKNGNIEAKAGSVCFKTTPFEGALGTTFDNDHVKTTLGLWYDVYYRSGMTNLLFENSTVGTLTTDNRNIYAIDDLALPIPPNMLHQQIFGQYKEDVRSLVQHNKLRAINMASGKIEWELGGDGGKSDEFSKSFFLCTPIAVGGKLYVLNEKESGELRLLCLDPGTGKLIARPQKLGSLKAEHTYFHDIARRVNAIHLGYAEGILVCPTNAGEVLGVDLMSQSLAWAYKYREKPPHPQAFPIGKGGGFNPPNANPNAVIALSYSNWKVAPPVVVDGKVVFTAPDSNAVCCVNLRDGSEVWTVPQLDADVYLAGVFLDKVIIVGKHSIRALKLSDGSSIGNPLQTGDLPSGQGVACNNIYYLPLRKGEICAIDLEHWAVKAHNRAKKPGSEAPGNLVFCEGMVLSQTARSIVAYPQLAAKLAEAEAAYLKNATVMNLLERGEMRLADGQVQKAVDDLIAVLAQKPPVEAIPRAKTRLYDALSDLLQADFPAAAPKYLKDYKELTKVSGNPREQLQREAKYWRIVAHGREAQGDLVEAFIAYKEFGGSPLFKDDGIPSLEDPLHKVPTHLWLRGHISAMLDKAKPDQRVALEKKIGEEWSAVKKQKQNDLEAIRQFIGMFDVPFAVGREARVELANAIIQGKVQNAYLEAEMNLQQLLVPGFRKNAQIGGTALEALARLQVAKGTDDALRLAASYYRDLNKDFPKEILRDGKTGADLFQALAEDPRMRPYLEEANISWGNTDLKHRKLEGDEIQGIQKFNGFVFQPEGDIPPLLRQHRLVLDGEQVNNPELRLVDIVNNKARWTTTLGVADPNANSRFFAYLNDEARQPNGFHPNAKYRYFHAKGHVAVIQVGLTAYGIDLDTGKKLWQHALHDPTKVQQSNGWSFALDEHGAIWAVHSMQFGGLTKARVGQIGTVQATYVALVTHKGLEVLDPVKGTLLWTKAGLAPNTEIFGDDQHIYYVEIAGGAGVGTGHCLRASDGATVDVPDFGPYYRNHQRIFAGRQILTAEQTFKTVTMRLYDAQTGKDVWKRTFVNDPVVLKTEDPRQCGMIERDTGKLVLLDAFTGEEIMTANMKQYQVEAKDLRDLYQPVLLDDGEYYFVALNIKPNNPGGINSNTSNNFSSFTPCLPVNGWFCCLDRKGEFLWHGMNRYLNQLILVEQFRAMPILLFSSRYITQLQDEKGQPGKVIRTSITGSISKATGKSIWWSPENRETDGKAEYFAFNIDFKTGTINLLGTDLGNRLFVNQFYQDDKNAPQKAGGKQAAFVGQDSDPVLGIQDRIGILSCESRRDLLLKEDE